MDNSLIYFKTHDYVLSISATLERWCKVWLETDCDKYYLGAELGSIIIERLYKALCGDRNSVSGKDGDITLSSVITLSEKHSSIYVGKQDSFLYLYVYDAEAKLLARVALSKDEVESWKSSLARLR